MTRWVLRGMVGVLGLVVVLVGGVAVGLNTGVGRALAVWGLNAVAGPEMRVEGLGGHFPADLKLERVDLADGHGVYAMAGDLELRWRPGALWAHKVDVTALTAGAIDFVREPVSQRSGRGDGGFKMPGVGLEVEKLVVRALTVGPAVAGQQVTLRVVGRGRLEGMGNGGLNLEGVAAGGMGTYVVSGAMDGKHLKARLTVAEPAGGLVGRLVAPSVRAPLDLELSVDGPETGARVDFAGGLGAVRVEAAGLVGMAATGVKANLVVTVPALAPVAALVGQEVAGNASVHLLASQANGATDLRADGTVDLTGGPGAVVKLVGDKGRVSLLASMAGGHVDVENLNVSGAGFEGAANGTVAGGTVFLNTHLGLKDVGVVSKGISGPLAVNGSVEGTANDFALNALLTGDISQGRIPSGPFSIAVNALHLPMTPVGTLTGSGALEGFPLLLDAAFERDESGALSVTVNNALWRSLSAEGAVAVAGGGGLPTGAGRFAVGNLADFTAFLPVKVSGSVSGDFSHETVQDFLLDLTAKNLVAVPQMGAVNGTLRAQGPVDALGVILSADIAKVLGAPARVAAAGVLDLNRRSVTLGSLAASWRSLDARLVGPAVVETVPGVAVRHLEMDLNGGRVTVDGVVSPKLGFTVGVKGLPASLVALLEPGVRASGVLDGSANLTGTVAAPVGTVQLNAMDIRVRGGVADSLPAADFSAGILLKGRSADLRTSLELGADVALAADGSVPLNATGAIDLHVTGKTDLRLLDPVLAADGNTVRGVVSPDLVVSGTGAAPLVNGSVVLADGSVQNVASGLNLTRIEAQLRAAGRVVTLESLKAVAGQGTISGHGSLDLDVVGWPVDLVVDAKGATPVASDLVTESLDAGVTVKGVLKGAMTVGGEIDLLKANINIPQSLPPSVANLPILNEGEMLPPSPAPPPDVALNLTVKAKRQIFIRGDGLFAELGGKVVLTGTAADPVPQGGFTLIRGDFSLAGKTLQFTQGTVDFTGDGFVPTLDLEATATTANNTTASLIVGGTAEKPTITLTATPPLPSDEVLSELLFGQATSSLSPFQAASLAAALASLSGVGGRAVADPLGGVRNALGLDELSLGGSGSGPPVVNAGRYVAPGVYVGAQQSTSGQGTQATVQVNLYKGLQLQTSTGTTGTGGGESSSVGLTYQFNY